MEKVCKLPLFFIVCRNVLYVHRSEILRDWECLWRLGFNDIKGDPVVSREKVTFNLHSTVSLWDKAFKNGTSKICGRQPLKNLK